MMNNIKIPYFVYPIIFGLMLGWLVAMVIGAVSARPKPLPAIKTAKATKAVASPMLTDKVIEDNVFALELKPDEQSVTEANGQVVYNPDGTIASGSPSQAAPPPPPFTAKLLGILKDAGGLNSIAIINMDNGTVSIKLGGEKNGLKLISLDELSAVVEKDRKKYTITIEKGSTIANTAQTKKGNAPQPAAAVKPNASQSSGTNINVNLNRDEVRSELKDLNKVLQSALVSPFYNDGQFLGYRVTRLRDDSPLRKLGLLPGDTITRINGNELKSPELLFNMLSQVDDISAISIDMIRNTEKKTIFVEIQ